jgi:flagellar biosynthesis/type III secretory pathway ATPase
MALRYFPKLQQFIQQDLSEAINLEDSVLQLKSLMDDVMQQQLQTRVV